MDSSIFYLLFGNNTKLRFLPVFDKIVRIRNPDPAVLSTGL
jgi:hypothetical protein